eukprot:1181614-Prorocentrum_minimum.AAC.6
MHNMCILLCDTYKEYELLNGATPETRTTTRTSIPWVDSPPRWVDSPPRWVDSPPRWVDSPPRWELYNTVINARNWNRLSDRGLRDAACKGHKHEVEFWCKGQAGVGGQMAQELDNFEQDWRQKAITRQKAKFAMLEYSRQRRTHEDEHAKALTTIAAAKELLAQKRKALLDEEEKVKGMEAKVKEALKASAAQMAAGEEALKQKELEEMVAWQQMQNKRQLVRAAY